MTAAPLVAPTRALLEVRGLDVVYNPDSAEPIHALRNVDLSVAPGEKVAIVGESGSGKTTLGMTVAGFLTASNARVTADTITFEGSPIPISGHGAIPRRVPGIAVVFQDAMTSLDPVWRIANQMLDVLRADRRLSRRAALDEARSWLRRVGLTDPDRVLHSRPDELSGGMRQRVMLALALCGRPRLLVADEPTSALDASLSREVMDLMDELTAELGTTLLIITHDIHLSRDYADTTVVMLGGEIVERGPSRTLERDAVHPYTQGLLNCVPTLESLYLDELPTLAVTR